MAETPIEVVHAQEAGSGTFSVVRAGVTVAEMGYTCVGPERVVIGHTEVDDALRGQGVGRKLLDACVAWARATGRRVGATCPYAKAELEKDPALEDVRA